MSFSQVPHSGHVLGQSPLNQTTDGVHHPQRRNGVAGRLPKIMIRRTSFSRQIRLAVRPD
jgi:hypothetical protein